MCEKLRARRRTRRNSTLGRTDTKECIGFACIRQSTLLIEIFRFDGRRPFSTRILTGVRVSPNTGTTNEEEKNKFHLVGRKLFFLVVGGFFLFLVKLLLGRRFRFHLFRGRRVFLGDRLFSRV